MAELVAWMTRDAQRLGHDEVLLAHTPEWHAANEDRVEKLALAKSCLVG